MCPDPNSQETARRHGRHRARPRLPFSIFDSVDTDLPRNQPHPIVFGPLALTSSPEAFDSILPPLFLCLFSCSSVGALKTSCVSSSHERAGRLRSFPTTLTPAAPGDLGKIREHDEGPRSKEQQQVISRSGTRTEDMLECIEALPGRT